MAKRVPGLTVVVAAPYQNLADQWCDILEAFNIQPIRCYVSRSDWYDELQRTIHDIEMGAVNFAAIVVVNRTLKSDSFQQAIARIRGKQFLWIGDECHHHASESFAGFLPSNAAYRIGLSATPEHYLDADRNSRLSAYYGQTVFTYSLKQAIEDKVLTPYNYYPHLVELTEDEAAAFIELSDDIANAFAREGKNSRISQGLTALLMKRSRLIASAYNKIPALLAVLSGQRPAAHTLFYCGDGRVDPHDGDDSHDDDDDDDDDDYSGEIALSGRQIEVVSQHLDALGWRLSRFTSREPRREREAILANFKMGLIDAMVAIKCLDEGIDVPACSTAYILASSRDPRQFIQRRGRILRRSPGKTIATIHDFIVILPASIQDGSGHARKLIESELRRVAEFSTLAANRSEAYERLREVLTAYDLEHVI
jgi:superfamily II DNA or RNA helicase